MKKVLKIGHLPYFQVEGNLKMATGTSAMQIAAAKSLQPCPTLFDPIVGSPPRLPRPWDPLGKNTGVGCHFLFQMQIMNVK